MIAFLNSQIASPRLYVASQPPAERLPSMFPLGFSALFSLSEMCRCLFLYMISVCLKKSASPPMTTPAKCSQKSNSQQRSSSQPPMLVVSADKKRINQRLMRFLFNIQNQSQKRRGLYRLLWVDMCCSLFGFHPPATPLCG